MLFIIYHNKKILREMDTLWVRLVANRGAKLLTVGQSWRCCFLFWFWSSEVCQFDVKVKADNKERWFFAGFQSDLYRLRSRGREDCSVSILYVWMFLYMSNWLSMIFLNSYCVKTQYFTVFLQDSLSTEKREKLHSPEHILKICRLGTHSRGSWYVYNF